MKRITLLVVILAAMMLMAGNAMAHDFLEGFYLEYPDTYEGIFEEYYLISSVGWGVAAECDDSCPCPAEASIGDGSTLWGLAEVYYLYQNYASMDSGNSTYGTFGTWLHIDLTGHIWGAGGWCAAAAAADYGVWQGW